jgi:outer membrane protein OmpA-like peptidoglycan-associated protein
MCNLVLRKGAVGLACLLLLLCWKSGSSNAQIVKPDQTAATLTVYQNNYVSYVNRLRPDTSADNWLEPHIAVSSRHYIGAELGTTRSWMMGDNNFFFPYHATGSQGELPFSSLGSGEGFQFGGVVDFSLSDFIGLQGKLRYFNTVTQSSESGTILTTGQDGLPHTFETVSSYLNTHTYLGADAFMRYQIVPQQYYLLGGAGVAWPISESYSASRTAAGVGNTYVPAFESNKSPSDSYFNSFRVDLKVGVGTFFPITDDMVVTPELMLSIPVTSYFNKNYEAFYKNAGVQTPHQWYATAAISIKFPNGGFSLYEIERDRHRKYFDQFRHASVLHPIPLLRVLEMAAIVNKIQPIALKPDTLPDYEVDGQGRLIRWEDIGPDATRKLHLVVFFEFGKADLADYNNTDLDRLARTMLKHSGLIFEIAAYTDSKGSIKKNLELSQSRATAVQGYLRKKGIDPLRIPARGYGPESPVASNDTPEGRASNRRVEFVLVKDQAMFGDE